MTTAMAFAVRGRFLAAFHAQPAGLTIFVTIVVLAFGSLRILIAGNLQFLRIQIGATKIAFLVVAVLLFGWAYKIMTFTP